MAVIGGSQSGVESQRIMAYKTSDQEERGSAGTCSLSCTVVGTQTGSQAVEVQQEICSNATDCVASAAAVKR